jgi:SynChlorMet cassette protein ScmC
MWKHRSKKDLWLAIMPSDGERWSMRLADGQSWEFKAGDGAGKWLKNAARIMGLEKSNGECQRRVTFIQRDPSSDVPPGPVEKEALEAPEEWKIECFEMVAFFSKRDVPHLICELFAKEGSIDEITGMARALYPIFLQSQANRGLPLHAALLERKGKGIVIAAPSGTGKSTCCHRIPPPWNVLCDDQTLAVCDSAGRYFAHPFPTWSEFAKGRSDRSWNVQRYVPLAGIFILQQSKTDFLKELGQGEAAPLIYHSARHICQRNLNYLKPDELDFARKMLFENACQMTKSVPAYLLGASLTGRFWEQIENAMEKPIEVLQGIG